MDSRMGELQSLYLSNLGVHEEEVIVTTSLIWYQRSYWFVDILSSQFK